MAYRTLHHPQDEEHPALELTDLNNNMYQPVSGDANDSKYPPLPVNGSGVSIEEPPGYKDSRQRACHFWGSPWIGELVGLFMSATSLLAAAVVLAQYDRKPLEQWTFVTSINTVISVLGVISKTMLAFAVSSACGQHKWNWFRARPDELQVFVKFDEASRGPWGSITLLLWSKARNLASLGALVIILTLLIDPFLQATVLLSGETQTATQRYVGPGDLTSGYREAWVPAAKRVNLGLVFDFSTYWMRPTVLDKDGYLLSSDVILPDFGMTSALYDGFYRTSDNRNTADSMGLNNQTVRFACETGNCTWPIFGTAAICSRCNDVPQSSIVRVTGVTDSFREGSDQYHSKNVSRAKKAPYTGYNVSYGHIRQFDGVFDQYYTEVLLTAFINTNYSQSVTFREDNTTFVTILVLRASHDFLNESVPWDKSWPTVTECGVSFCAKAYLSTATNGLLDETELGTWSVREPRSWSAFDIYQSEDWKGDKDRLRDWDRYHPTFDVTGDQLQRTDLQVLIPHVDRPVILPNKTAVDLNSALRERSFNFSRTTVVGLQGAIKDLFLGESPSQSSAGEMINRSFVVYPIGDPTASKPIANILWNATDNLTATFDRVAQRLTVQMRNAASNEMDRKHGTAVRYVLHIRVQWGYFSVLAVTVVGGCVYVVLVLVQTYRLGLPAWKESAYPTLAFAPDDAPTLGFLRRVSGVEKSRRPREVKRSRGQMVVGLTDAGDGDYRLRRAEKDPNGET